VSIYERLGLRTIVNARGTHTRLGGTLMLPEVLDAMREAAGAYVVLEELQERASAIIARATGAEAGMVTGGAAAGLLLATAACIAGEDPAKIAQLPDTTGMKGEAVMHRAHRNGYDHSVRAAGATMVDVGSREGTTAAEFDAAITDRTALVVYLMSPWAGLGALSLAETCAVAHARGVPVLVDAAAVLPPAINLTRFVAEGADLVTFSGGKGLRGPQSSGILAGRADLIRAALKNGSPNHSVGRAAKAAKEDIVGLLVALEAYLARDHDADLAHWQAQSEYLAERLAGLPGVEVNCVYDGREHITPRVELVIDRATGIDAHELVVALETSETRIYLFEPNGPTARPNSIVINTHTMLPGDERIIAEVLRPAIEGRIGVKMSPGE
jgi:D-glucosaminate-6-phosphate ammonia-lyase